VRLQTARETEAARISRELHDEIGQVLTSLKIDLARLRACCPSESSESRCARALAADSEAMSAKIGGAIDFVRRIASELRPGVLDRLGLAAALEWQARELEGRSRLAVQLDIEELPPRIDEAASVGLFRIAQEALTNVVRHAQASLVEIRLGAEGGELVLSVRDDGRGFDPDSRAGAETLGLAGMRERAALLGGALTIAAAPGGGTLIRAVVPLRPPDPEEPDAHPAG
jgi:signal transduction histidine kinase